MKEIKEVFRNVKRINKISIINFVTVNEDLEIEMDVTLENKNFLKIYFFEVSRLKIDYSLQIVYEKPIIEVEDVSYLQWEGVRYNFQLTDIMSFYCRSINSELVNHF